MTGNKKINKAVKSAIIMAGSQTELSMLCGVAQQTVSDWLNGKMSPSPRKAVKIELATDGRVNRRDVLPDFPWD